jgi:prepilin-type N-terminal cleavage/methylation domain-containing protein
MKAYRARVNGFTLIEILIVMFIMSMVVTAVYMLFYRSQKAYTDQDQFVQLQQNLRSALEMMSQELRTAGCWPNIYLSPPDSAIKGGAWAGTATPVNTIRIIADLDPIGTAGSGTIDPAKGEDITYQFVLPGGSTVGELRRDTNEGGGAQVIASNIVDFQIFYFALADGSYRGILPKNANGTIGAASPNYMTQDPIHRLSGNSQDNLNAIRLVRLVATAQTPYPDPNYGLNGGYRRYTLTVDVALRNLYYKWGG